MRLRTQFNDEWIIGLEKQPYPKSLATETSRLMPYMVFALDRKAKRYYVSNHRTYQAAERKYIRNCKQYLGLNPGKASIKRKIGVIDVKQPKQI